MSELIAELLFSALGSVPNWKYEEGKKGQTPSFVTMSKSMVVIVTQEALIIIQGDQPEITKSPYAAQLFDHLRAGMEM